MGINDGKGNIEHLRKRVREECFPGTCRADEQNVRLRKLHIIATRLVHLDALVVVVDGDGKLLLGLILTNHVLVEEGLNLLRLRKMRGRRAGRGLSAIVFEDRVADGYALIADIGARVVRRGGDKLGNRILRFVAKRAAKRDRQCRATFSFGEQLLSRPR